MLTMHASYARCAITSPLHPTPQFAWCSSQHSLVLHADGRSPLHLAALKGHSSVVKFLVSKQAWADSQDAEDSTALHLAARSAVLSLTSASSAFSHTFFTSVIGMRPVVRALSVLQHVCHTVK